MIDKDKSEKNYPPEAVVMRISASDPVDEEFWWNQISQYDKKGGSTESKQDIISEFQGAFYGNIMVFIKELSRETHENYAETLNSGHIDEPTMNLIRNRMEVAAGSVIWHLIREIAMNPEKLKFFLDNACDDELCHFGISARRFINIWSPLSTTLQDYEENGV